MSYRRTILTIKDGRLRVSKPAAPREHRTPIDSFFVSLAEDQCENAACVILSGTGSDGTLDHRAIKEHGGVTLAQTSDSVEYAGMMRSAIGTGLVDFVLPADETQAARPNAKIGSDRIYPYSPARFSHL